MTVLFATLFVAALWALTIALLAGLGASLVLGGERDADDRDALRALALPFTGYALALGLLQLWNLFLPVDGLALAALSAGGFAGLLARRRALRRALGRLWRPERAALLVAGGLSLWLANIATGTCDYGDTGMYHLPMARWLAASEVVPGLANLHGRFGFNNASLLFAALFEGGGFAGRSHHFVNGPLVVPFLALVLCGVRGALRRESEDRVARVFLASLLPVVVHAGLSRHLTSLSTDLPTGLLLLVAGWRLLVSWRTSDAGREAPATALLLATAVAIKLPALPFAALGCGWLLVALRRAPHRTRAAALRTLALVLAVAVPWVCRGVLLSGYPAYPASVAGFDVPWRVPAEQANAEHAWALASCRTTGQGDPAQPWQAWVREWLRQRGLGVLAGFPALLGLLWLALGALGRGAGRSAARSPLPLVPLAATCLAIWFVTGPNPRFGFGIAWTFAAASAAWCVHRAGAAGARPAARALLAALLLGSATYAVLWVVRDPKLHWRERWLVRAPGDDAGLHPYKSPPLRTFVTDAGDALLVPTRSNNAWGAPLPNTPYPAPNLRQRDPDDPFAGFVTDGPWQPERWPKEGSEFLRRWRAARER